MKYLLMFLAMSSSVYAANDSLEKRSFEATEVRFRKKVAATLNVPLISKLKVSPSVEVSYKVKESSTSKSEYKPHPSLVVEEAF